LFLVALSGPAGPVSAASAPKAPTYHEIAFGSPKAKLTVVEYASLTCPHCGDFARNTFPQIKQAYIATGKVRFIYRDMPIDALAAAAATIARCAPAGEGAKLIEVMYQNQSSWGQVAKPIEPLRAYAQLAGMTDGEIDACLKDATIRQIMQDEQTKGTTLYRVEKTPTFFIGE
jgi:protein-disulfide isomerase